MGQLAEGRWGQGLDQPVLERPAGPCFLPWGEGHPRPGVPNQCLETHLVSETSSACVQSFFSFCSQIMRTNSKPTFPKDQKILSFPEAPPPGLPRPL